MPRYWKPWYELIGWACLGGALATGFAGVAHATGDILLGVIWAAIYGLGLWSLLKSWD